MQSRTDPQATLLTDLYGKYVCLTSGVVICVTHSLQQQMRSEAALPEQQRRQVDGREVCLEAHGSSVGTKTELATRFCFSWLIWLCGARWGSALIVGLVNLLIRLCLRLLVRVHTDRLSGLDGCAGAAITVVTTDTRPAITAREDLQIMRKNFGAIGISRCELHCAIAPVDARSCSDGPAL